MQIDWGKTINDIFESKMSCPRCGALDSNMVAGYSRSPALAEYAPRCQKCDHKEECDARKLIVLCEECAREVRLRARPVDQPGLMTLLVNDCRRDLEDYIDYLTDYWQDDLEIEPGDIDKRLEEVAPDVFAEEDAWRRRLEEEYLSYHRWFRERNLRIPDPGWRSDYAEEIIALGYKTLLGD